jgi:hypothetical protein
MGRGGARLGAGRKPAIRPGLGLEAVSRPEAAAVPVSASVPADLPSEQIVYWCRYAPLAVQARTLTETTAPAFRMLCELEAERSAVKADLDRDGRMVVKVSVDDGGTVTREKRLHPLTAHYLRLCRQVEALLARFTLAPFGKASLAGRPPDEAAARQAERRAAFFGWSPAPKIGE